MNKFPGNQALLAMPGVVVLATDEGAAAVNKAVESEMQWWGFGPAYVERSIARDYSGDPMVMRLLDEYLALVDRVAAAETTVEPELFEGLELTPEMKPWQKL